MHSVVRELPSSSRSDAILSSLLQQAGISLNGSRPDEIPIHHPRLFRPRMKNDSPGLAEGYMTGWWDCACLNMFFERALRAGQERQRPGNGRDWLYLLNVRLVNQQSRRRAGQVARHGVDPWISRYIFSHGRRPSPSDIAAHSDAGFVMEGGHNFSPDADKTWITWEARFFPRRLAAVEGVLR